MSCDSHCTSGFWWGESIIVFLLVCVPDLSSCLTSRHFVSIRSDQISHSVVSDSLWPHESQHARPPCPSPTPGAHWDPRPSSQWCHAAISSSVVPFSSCPQSLPASESFPMSPHTYGQLIYRKALYIMEKDILFNKWCWENWRAPCQRMKLEH